MIKWGAEKKLICENKNWWVKYLLITIITCLIGVINLYSNATLTIAWILTLVLSMMFFSKKFTWYSFILLIIVGVSSTITAVKRHPQLYGDLWYTPVFSLVIQLFITFLVFLSLAVLVECTIKNFNRNKEEQNSMLDRISFITNRTSQISENIDAEIKRYISITDKSRDSSDAIRELANQVDSKVEVNTEHINRAFNAIENISQGIKNISAHLENIAGMSTEASESKQNVKGFIDSATEQMININKNKQESKKLIYKVGERSLEVKRVVEIISSIARDTKLVAFNAQVESAKAGIQGESFAVIAVEVVKLAELSKQAATEITEFINDIEIQSKKAMENIDSGSQMINRGLGSFNTLNAIFNSFSEVSDEKERQIQCLSNESKEIADTALEIAQRVKKIKEINQKGVENFKDINHLYEKQYNFMQQIKNKYKNK